MSAKMAFDLTAHPDPELITMALEEINQTVQITQPKGGYYLTFECNTNLVFPLMYRLEREGYAVQRVLLASGGNLHRTTIEISWWRPMPEIKQPKSEPKAPSP